MLRLAFDFIITWRETRTRPNAYLFFMNLSKAILIFSFLYFLGFFVWGNFSELYKPLFILYVVLVEILNIVGINYIFKRRIYEK